MTANTFKTPDCAACGCVDNGACLCGSPRALSGDALRGLTVDAINSGLSCYRPDLRYTRADAAAFADLWNATKASTRATVIRADGFPRVIVVDLP